MEIRPLQADDHAERLRMWLALWPHHTVQELEEDIAYIATQPDAITFVAVRPEGGLGGFLEAGLRPYADGCDTRPVGYIEGWYVDPDLRLQGVGADLVRAAEDWVRQQGCSEMASDCELDNVISLSAHTALGYQETERLIHFRKSLR